MPAYQNRSAKRQSTVYSIDVMLKKYTDLDARAIIKGIKDKNFSALDCAEALIAQAKRWETINAFVTFRPDQLREDARKIDSQLAKGKDLGPLAGLPIFVKDLIDTAEYPTTSGTPALKSYQPKSNGPIVQRLLDAGAVIAGKTNLHELGYGITSNNAFTGAVHNPYNLDLIPGGSSGGSAAAVAARIGVVGLGTDTGGSMRIPAALCGVAGLRPTLGRWPSAGMEPASHSRDVIGPFGRTVADIALLDMVVTGDPLAKAAKLKGVRLGIPESTNWTDLDPETEVIARAARTSLEKAGADFVSVDLAEIVALDQKYGFPIALFETHLDAPSYLIAGDTGVAYDELIKGVATPTVAAILAQIPSVTIEVYREALEGRAKIQSLYAALWRKHNIAALVFPTTPLPARPIGQEDTVELNGRQVPTFPTYIRNTGPTSIAGLPGLSIPIGLTKSGLPVGLEFDGPSWHDRGLLSIGLAAEQIFTPLPAPSPQTV